MQPTSPAPAASPIQVPKVDIDEPVAVIPIASVAPLDGPPDGERVNAFTLVPRKSHRSTAESALGEMRSRVGGRPFTYLAAAFSLGYVVARMMR